MEREWAAVCVGKPVGTGWVRLHRAGLAPGRRRELGAVGGCRETVRRCWGRGSGGGAGEEEPLGM